MVELQGIAVSPGVAIGPALVLDPAGYRVPRSLIAADEVDAEYARLQSAIDESFAALQAQQIETGYN